jgi:hypothetical protein
MTTMDVEPTLERREFGTEWRRLAHIAMLGKVMLG